MEGSASANSDTYAADKLMHAVRCMRQLRDENIGADEELYPAFHYAVLALCALVNWPSSDYAGVSKKVYSISIKAFNSWLADVGNFSLQKSKREFL